MNKLVAPSFIGVLCALVLASSTAGPAPLPLDSNRQVASSGPSRVSLGAATGDGAGTPGAGNSPTGTALTPAVDPDIRVASPTPPLDAAPPTAPAAAAVGPALDIRPVQDPSPAPSAGPTVTSDPAAAQPADEVPSIPPLWAPEAELASPPPATSAPTASGPATSESLAALPATEALVKDNNSAAILTVFTKINEYRASKGLKPVKYNPTVAGLAQDWSDNIASREVIEHRANFWTDPRAMNPNNGAGEVIAIRTDRDAAQLVEWWKGSPGHNAMLIDPRFNVMGAGISYTNSTFQIWGVVNFFGYTTLPAGTVDSPGGSSSGGGSAFPPPAPTLCDATGRHMPPTLDLSAAAITGPGDLVTVNSSGQLLNRASTGVRTYAAAKVIGSGFTGAKEVFVTDWDRDGAYDLVTQWTNGNLTLHRGIATGGFQAAITLGSGGWQSLTLAMGGWCANNRMPQILALDSSGNLFLYPNKGTSDLSARALITSGITASRLAMVDYDADGFQDVLALRADGAAQLYRGWGTTALRAEARPTVATGWQDVTGIRPLKNVTGLNSTGVALRRASDVVQYWDLSGGTLASPSNITGPWTGQRLAQ
ncbi:CAP domain-containing protein [Pseudarthrobacter sp. SL88]|uniref:CAP domain-containing protein n=1 Tax=Pseudarthrobacter sp. SL88 TaxID=2994666 RepID=UPI00227274B4|nr:CAP domain-containing protein [Pseudarthrobacter sp. SL88]MCY1673153.1 CAP domain-containing protein [Pseudarthrobacter sp. SL88]